MRRQSLKKDVISYLGPNTAIEGEFHANGDIHIDGAFSGDVVCNGHVILGEGSQVSGVIRAASIYVAGTFSGRIDVSNLLEVAPTGHIDGDIKGAQLIVREGGIYKGNVTMDVIEASSLYEGSFQIMCP